MANRVRFNVLATLLCAVQVFSSCLLVTEHPVYVRREAGHNGGGIDAEISQDATVANDGAWEDRSTDDSVSGDLGATDRVMDDGGANDHASMPDATLDSGGGCGCPLGTRSTEKKHGARSVLAESGARSAVVFLMVASHASSGSTVGDAHSVASPTGHAVSTQDAAARNAGVLVLKGQAT